MRPAPGRLTKAEVAREPRMLHVLAWFDGNARGSNPNARPMDMPRRLTVDEAASWREGWMEGLAERRCHEAHGFLPCPGEHWEGMAEELIAADLKRIRETLDKPLAMRQDDTRE
jgi:hypothetical protein